MPGRFPAGHYFAGLNAISLADDAIMLIMARWYEHMRHLGGYSSLRCRRAKFTHQDIEKSTIFLLQSSILGATSRRCASIFGDTTISRPVTAPRRRFYFAAAGRSAHFTAFTAGFTYFLLSPKTFRLMIRHKYNTASAKSLAGQRWGGFA